MTETIESALTIARACPDLTVYASMALNNLKARVPEAVKELILCPEGNNGNHTWPSAFWWRPRRIIPNEATACSSPARRRGWSFPTCCWWIRRLNVSISSQASADSPSDSKPQECEPSLFAKLNLTAAPSCVGIGRTCRSMKTCVRSTAGHTGAQSSLFAGIPLPALQHGRTKAWRRR